MKKNSHELLFLFFRKSHELLVRAQTSTKVGKLDYNKRRLIAARGNSRY